MGSGMGTPAAAGAEGVHDVNVGYRVKFAPGSAGDGLRLQQQQTQPCSANSLSTAERAATYASLAVLFKVHFSLK